MSIQIKGFYFSANADKSANDYTVYLDEQQNGNYKLSIRYKNAEPNHLYEIELDCDDVHALGEMLLGIK